MAKRKIEFGIIARFIDQFSSKFRGFQARLRASMAGGLFGRSAGTGGISSGLMGRLATRPGGIGGIFSGVMQGATGLLLLPARIISSFASLIPLVGGVLNSVVRSAANILQGLVTVAANVVGGIINAFGKLLRSVAAIFGRMVGIIGRILGRIGKIAGGIFLGIGAVSAWQFIKGLRENMGLADLRAIMKKIFGPIAKKMEDMARAVSLKTPFTPTELIRTVVTLGAARVKVRKYLGDVLDLAAGTKGLGIRLEDVVRVFARLRAGTFGEAFERLREMTISRMELEKVGLAFGKSGAFLGTPMQAIAGVVEVIRQRFHGMAEEAAEVGSGPWSTFVGAIENLRVQLTEPWYDRFNNALKDINKGLLKLAGARSWREIIAKSRALADTVDGWIRGVFIPAMQAGWRAATEFGAKVTGAFAGREWGLSNLKSALAEIPQFVTAQLPNALKILRSGLKIVGLEIHLWLKQLWQSIGPEVTAGLYIVAQKVFEGLDIVHQHIVAMYNKQNKAVRMYTEVYMIASRGAVHAMGDAVTELGRKAKAEQKRLEGATVEPGKYRDEIEQLQAGMAAPTGAIAAAARGLGARALPKRAPGAVAPATPEMPQSLESTAEMDRLLRSAQSYAGAAQSAAHTYPQQALNLMAKSQAELSKLTRMLEKMGKSTVQFGETFAARIEEINTRLLDATYRLDKIEGRVGRMATAR